MSKLFLSLWVEALTGSIRCHKAANKKRKHIENYSMCFFASALWASALTGCFYSSMGKTK